MPKIKAALVSLVLLLLPLLRAEPANVRITITAGTPVQVSTQHIRVHNILIQMRTGGTGRGYVIRVKPGTTPDASNGAHLSAELCPAAATAPGCSYSDQEFTPLGARKEIYLDWLWIDGSVTSDTVTVSYDTY